MRETSVHSHTLRCAKFTETRAVAVVKNTQAVLRKAERLVCLFLYFGWIFAIG